MFKHTQLCRSVVYNWVRCRTDNALVHCSSYKIAELSQSNVHIKDQENVLTVLQKMIRDGGQKLQIVADFDRTLSKYTHRGNVCATCHTVLEEGGLPKEYKEQALRIRDKYFPIESDPNMTIEEKIPFMVEWWTQAHETLLKYPLNKTMLANMVAESTAKLRDGCTDFFDKLHTAEVPLLIFSAGVGDVIREVISQSSTTVYDNMHIVSNDIEFNDEGWMVGFKGDMIHVFNKSEAAIHDSDYFQNLSHRTNVLLLGDSLGDLQMANGAEHDAKLTIGFLNTRVVDSLELYKDNFDIVIVTDESLDVANAIVNNILKASTD